MTAVPLLPSSLPTQSPSDTEQPPQSDLSLALLTAVLIGIQFTWTVELAYGTPYLLSLGLPNSWSALVWLAGPLSGLIVQPLIGLYSDRITLPPHSSARVLQEEVRGNLPLDSPSNTNGSGKAGSWTGLGRRVPIMITGGITLILAMLSIGFSSFLATLLSPSPTLTSPYRAGIEIMIVIAGFYVLDFSINAVQAASRALILDQCPGHLQAKANAWASIMIGTGNILGYIVGTLDLSAGSSWGQMKSLCCLAVLVFGLTLGLTSWYVYKDANCAQENSSPLKGVPAANEAEKSHCPSPTRSGGPSYSSIPSTSTLESHINSDGLTIDTSGLKSKPSTPLNGVQQDNRQVALIGALLEIRHVALNLPFAIKRICLVQFFSWLGWFPFLFYSTSWISYLTVAAQPKGLPSDTTTQLTLSGLEALGARNGSFAMFIFSAVSLLVVCGLPDLTARMKHHGGAYRIWLASLYLFAALMFCTWWIRQSVWAGTIVIGLTGIPWAVCTWVPFVLVGEHLAADQSDDDDDDEGKDGIQSTPGLILGIHNMFIVLPQFMSSVLCSLIFWAVQSADPFGWGLRSSVLWSCVAAVLGAWHS